MIFTLFYVFYSTSKYLYGNYYARLQKLVTTTTTCRDSESEEGGEGKAREQICEKGIKCTRNRDSYEDLCNAAQESESHKEDIVVPNAEMKFHLSPSECNYGAVLNVLNSSKYINKIKKVLTFRVSSYAA
jgi:hypothetical protein